VSVVVFLLLLVCYLGEGGGFFVVLFFSFFPASIIRLYSVISTVIKRKMIVSRAK